MTAAPDLPTSGYSLDRIYVSEQSYRLADPTGEYPADPEIGFGWDWRIVAGAIFDVTVRIRIGPTEARPEEAIVCLVGVFQRVGTTQSTDLLDFTRVGGPAILLPYLREALSSLTGRGYHGVLLLPPLNVLAMMANANADETTGMRQIAARDPLALGFGAVPGAQSSGAPD